MTDGNDKALEAALREGGHHAAADHLRDSGLAADLRAAGYEQLADQLASKAGGTAQPTPAPDSAAQAEPSEGERFVAELQHALDSPWTSVPGLLGTERSSENG